MATLEGNSVQSTYKSLIKISDNSFGFGTLKQLSDGDGNVMPIEFSSTVIDFTNATTADFTGVNVIGISTTDTTYDLSSAQSTNDVNINLVPSTGATDTVKLIAGTGITLTDNGSNGVQIDGSALGVTSLEGLSGALTLTGTQNITITDNGSNIIDIEGYDDSQVTTNTANIATNATNISNNTGNIATNTTAISQLDADVNTNSTNIATNTGNIATNTTNIATNTGNIATNTTNIATNTSDIATINAAGYVNKTGTPVGAQVAYFADVDTIQGEAGFTYSAANDRLDVENIQVAEDLRTEKNLYFTLPAVNQASGELADFGSFPAAPALLRMYYFASSGFWIAANNAALGTTQGILGVALSSTEVLLRGMVRTTQTFTRGQELWLASNGTFATTQPSGGSFARIVGHAISTNTVYFNPSQEYIETT
jgi:hypothetical protein